MLSGIFLGFVVALSLVITYNSLPGDKDIRLVLSKLGINVPLDKNLDIKNWIQKHKLVGDIGATIIIYLTVSMFSKTLVALIATVFGELFIAVLLHASDVKEKDPEFYNAVYRVIRKVQTNSYNYLRSLVMGVDRRTS